MKLKLTSLPVNGTHTHPGSFMLHVSWFAPTSHQSQGQIFWYLHPSSSHHHALSWVNVLTSVPHFIQPTKESTLLRGRSTSHLPSNLAVASYWPWYGDHLVSHKVRPYLWYLWFCLVLQFPLSAPPPQKLNPLTCWTPLDFPTSQVHL